MCAPLGEKPLAPMRSPFQGLPDSPSGLWYLSPPLQRRAEVGIPAIRVVHRGINSSPVPYGGHIPQIWGYNAIQPLHLVFLSPNWPGQTAEEFTPGCSR